MKSADDTLLEFVGNTTGATVINGRITELDLRPMAGALDYFNEHLVEALRDVEVLTLGDVMLSTLDLSGFKKLRELRLGSVARGLWVNVSECHALTRFSLEPCAFEEGQTTNVLCRADQLSEADASELERRRTGSTGCSLIFSILGTHGDQRVKPQGGEVLGWLSRHANVEPEFQRKDFRRMRDIEARVASDFFTSRVEHFDAATEPYLQTRDANVTYARELPACMFKV